jgi:hypothetical protein
MIVQKKMECRLAGETEVLGENLPQRHFPAGLDSTKKFHAIDSATIVSG